MRKGVAVIAVAFAMAAFSASLASGQGDDQPGWDFEAYLAEAYGAGALTVSVGPDHVGVDWSDIEFGAQASRDVRDLADGALGGEPDGVVTAQEAEDFQIALRVLLEREFGKFANHRAFSGIVLIDQAEAQDVEITGLQASGLAGDVEGDETIKLSWQAVVAFPNVDKGNDLHVVRVDLGSYSIQQGHEDEVEDATKDLEVTITGAPGWAIDAASVEPTCAQDTFDGESLVFVGQDVDCFTGRSGVLLAFAITGNGEDDPNFLPGFEVAGLVAALGVGMSVLRRRR